METSLERSTKDVRIGIVDTALLCYPNKSHRKSISIPFESKDLAELMGIIFGDGGINNNWQLVISLNSLLDQEYSVYIATLIQTLFNLTVVQRIRPGQNTLVLVSSSTTLVDFLISKGAKRGNKILQKIDIPAWIKIEPEFKIPFVRGLVDTDGCLYIHKHTVKGKKYSHIGFCFTSFSKQLVLSVAEVLSEFGIKPHITDNGRRIYLYGEKSIVQYLNIFGSSNSRITKIYDLWRGRIVA